MKKQILILLTCIAAAVSNAADTQPAPQLTTEAAPKAPPAAAVEAKSGLGLFDAGRVSISPFAAAKYTEVGRTSRKLGGGLAVSYAVVDNIAVEVGALSYKLTDNTLLDSIDESAVNFKGYLPLAKSINLIVPVDLAPYGLIGYTRDIAHDDNLMNAGAGVSLRFSHVELFADGQYRQAFVHAGNQFLFRVGLGATF